MNQPKEHPILFSAPMVRAILAGEKTVTRRIVKSQYLSAEWSVKPATAPRHERHTHDWWLPTGVQPYAALPHCPYGQPGDRLWVRETTEIDEKTSPVVTLARYAADGQPVIYRSTEDHEYDGTVAHWDYPRRARPSIHMPRWASRILLEITSVSVERLQAITDEQAQAEGMVYTDFGMQERPGRFSVDGGKTFHPMKPQQASGWHAGDATHPDQCLDRARWAFANLWEKINGSGTWDANPWVWVVEFKRVTP